MKNPESGVEPIEGERSVYLVRSSSRSERFHRVDMEEFDCSGMCSCEDFDFRCYGKLASGKTPTIDLECKHIHSVRRWISFHYTNHLARNKS